AVPALLLMPDQTLRVAALATVVVGAVSLCARQWLARRQHAFLALLVLLATVFAAARAAVSLDEAGYTTPAVALLLAAVATSLISWRRFEAPAGI
ncbi:MAG TPA: hypothetical protein VFX49_05555, partial [Chloroflexota bacterium]|nr:hypothetical protein [Chloroflexota bacterium]